MSEYSEQILIQTRTETMHSAFDVHCLQVADVNVMYISVYKPGLTVWQVTWLLKCELFVPNWVFSQQL